MTPGARLLRERASDECWRHEDFLIRADEAVSITDHWQPVAAFGRSFESATRHEICLPDAEDSSLPSTQERMNGSSANRPEIDPADPRAWELEPSHLLETYAPTPDAVEFPLPHFDSEARRTFYSRDAFDRPLLRAADFKAKMIVNASGLTSTRGRARLEHVLVDLFADRPDAQTYRVWWDLAKLVDDAAVAELTVELKELWDETPAFWLYRVAPNVPPRFHENARNQFSWRGALRIAARLPWECAEHLLNHDRLSDWRDLEGPCPGFWSFAAFSEVLASGDEAEAAALDAFRRNHRGNVHARAIDQGGRWPGRVTVVRKHTGCVGPKETARLNHIYEIWCAKRDNREPPPPPDSKSRRRKARKFGGSKPK